MPKQMPLKYLVSSDRDRSWGITVDNIGENCIAPGYKSYLSSTIGYSENCDIRQGRILDNYLLLYVSQGKGWLHESPDKRVGIEAGTMLFIPPYLWHCYYPDKRSGWQEYWIQFRGVHIDNRCDNGFFVRDKVIHSVGLHEHIVDLYKEALNVALTERPGYQPVLAAIAGSLLSYTIYYGVNEIADNDPVAEKIDRARCIMRENMLTDISPEEIAKRIDMSYSWFRKTFKEYTNVSPAHYITQLKLHQAKMMLLNSTLNVREIALTLNYEDAAYFSAIFKKYVGCSPSVFKSACDG